MNKNILSMALVIVCAMAMHSSHGMLRYAARAFGLSKTLPKAAMAAQALKQATKPVAMARAVGTLPAWATKAPKFVLVTFGAAAVAAPVVLCDADAVARKRADEGAKEGIEVLGRVLAAIKEREKTLWQCKEQEGFSEYNMQCRQMRHDGQGAISELELAIRKLQESLQTDSETLVNELRDEATERMYKSRDLTKSAEDWRTLLQSDPLYLSQFIRKK